MKSILQNEKVCFLTGTTKDLDKHHIMNGALRDKSEKYGLWVWLNHDVHMWLHQTAAGAEKARELKAQAQEAFEKEHSHSAWMGAFYKNYL